MDKMDFPVTGIVKIRSGSFEGLGLVKEMSNHGVTIEHPLIGVKSYTYPQLDSAEKAFSPENVKILQDAGLDVTVAEKYPGDEE